MTKAKHTPGPWAKDAKGLEVYSASTDEVVASFPLPLNISDAHLVAAAPELFAALEAILDAGKIARPFGPFVEDGKIPAELYREGRVAIAKARGENAELAA